MGFFDRTTDLPQLIRRCQQGDSDAWGDVVDRFADFVYSVARRHRLNTDEAEDVFQTTFQALYASINQIDNPQALPKWLGVTASRSSQRIIRLRGNTVSLQTEAVDLTEMLASEDESAEEASLQACDALTVRESLVKLGGRCKQLLESLYFVEDASYQHISEAIGIPIGAIGPTRARCLDKLRKILSEVGFFG